MGAMRAPELGVALAARGARGRPRGAETRPCPAADCFMANN